MLNMAGAVVTVSSSSVFFTNTSFLSVALSHVPTSPAVMLSPRGNAEPRAKSATRSTVYRETSSDNPFASANESEANPRYPAALRPVVHVVGVHANWPHVCAPALGSALN